MTRGKKSMVATHPKIAEIQKDLEKEISIVAISRKYGVSAPALYRYLRNLPKHVQDIRTAAEVERGERILKLVVFLQEKLLGIQASAEKAGLDATSISAMRACLDNLQFHAKLTGKLPAEAPTVAVQVNILEHPDFKLFKQVLFRTLGPFREARLAVAQGFIAQERLLKARGDDAI